MSADVASAEQQRPAGAQPKQEQEDEDIAMETEEQENDLQNVEAKELKPEQMDSAKPRRKGIWMHVSVTLAHHAQSSQKSLVVGLHFLCDPCGWERQ